MRGSYQKFYESLPFQALSACWWLSFFGPLASHFPLYGFLTGPTYGSDFQLRLVAPSLCRQAKGQGVPHIDTPWLRLRSTARAFACPLES